MSALITESSSCPPGRITYVITGNMRPLRPVPFQAKPPRTTKSVKRIRYATMLVLLLLAFVCLVAGAPYYVPLQGVVGGKRTMVLLDKVEKKESYSQFFNDLGTFGLILLLLSLLIRHFLSCYRGTRT